MNVNKIRKCKKCDVPMTTDNAYHRIDMNIDGKRKIVYVRSLCKECARKKEREAYIPKYGRRSGEKRVMLTNITVDESTALQIRKIASSEYMGNLSYACRELLLEALKERGVK